MDRQLSDYVAALLAHSPQIEKAFDQTRRNVLRDLQLLGTLEGIARQSLLPWLEEVQPTVVAESVSTAGVAPAPSPAAERQAVEAQAPAPLPAKSPVQPRESSFDSKRSEYKPALRDQGLVEALLEFHRRNLPARAKQHLSRGVERSFSTQALPEVEAEQKTGPSFRQKSPGIYQPILRTPKVRT